MQYVILTKNFIIMEKNEKSFEVILSPTDMLERELEGVLGGCFNYDCGNFGCVMFDDCSFFDCKIHGNCPPGYIWDAVKCKCVIPKEENQ